MGRGKKKVKNTALRIRDWTSSGMKILGPKKSLDFCNFNKNTGLSFNWTIKALKVI